jgi:hypothetical protein
LQGLLIVRCGTEPKCVTRLAPILLWKQNFEQSKKMHKTERNPKRFATYLN